MTPEELAIELNISAKVLRAWLRRAYPRSGTDKWTRWLLTNEQISAAGARFSKVDRPQSVAAPLIELRRREEGRANSDESYVMDLCDEVLAEKASRQHRFTWLTGDTGKSGRCALLPVDGYYSGHGLVIEYGEPQHDQRVPFFDKEDRITVSGVHRGEQRRLYDERRKREIPLHGLRYVVIKWSELDADSRGRLRRNKVSDVKKIRSLMLPTSHMS